MSRVIGALIGVAICLFVITPIMLWLDRRPSRAKREALASLAAGLPVMKAADERVASDYDDRHAIVEVRVHGYRLDVGPVILDRVTIELAQDGASWNAIVVAPTITVVAEESPFRFDGIWVDVPIKIQHAYSKMTGLDGPAEIQLHTGFEGQWVNPPGGKMDLVFPGKFFTVNLSGQAPRD